MPPEEITHQFFGPPARLLVTNAENAELRFDINIRGTADE
jgi:hypothetical protein